MRLCAQCRREIPESLTGQSSTGQSSAGEAAGGLSRPDQEGTVWSPIARLTNLAEVGYFADILQGAGFATNVQQQQDFSAVNGHWQSLFILRVPQPDARAASERLRTEVASHSTDDEGSDEYDEELPTGASHRGSLLTPILVVLIAGGLAYVAGRGGLGGGPPDRAGNDLRRALSETSGPWTSHSRPDGTGPGRRLQFDPNSRVLVLEDDWDGDGRFERQRRFRVPR